MVKFQLHVLLHGLKLQLKSLIYIDKSIRIYVANPFNPVRLWVGPPDQSRDCSVSSGFFFVRLFLLYMFLGVRIKQQFNDLVC